MTYNFFHALHPRTLGHRPPVPGTGAPLGLGSIHARQADRIHARDDEEPGPILTGTRLIQEGDRRDIHLYGPRCKIRLPIALDHELI
jgi:hypothetical protein